MQLENPPEIVRKKVRSRPSDLRYRNSLLDDASSTWRPFDAEQNETGWIINPASPRDSAFQKRYEEEVIGRFMVKDSMKKRSAKCESETSFTSSTVTAKTTPSRTFLDSITSSERGHLTGMTTSATTSKLPEYQRSDKPALDYGERSIEKPLDSVLENNWQQPWGAVLENGGKPDPEASYNFIPPGLEPTDPLINKQQRSITSPSRKIAGLAPQQADRSRNYGGVDDDFGQQLPSFLFGPPRIAEPENYVFSATESHMSSLTGFNSPDVRELKAGNKSRALLDHQDDVNSFDDQNDGAWSLFTADSSVFETLPQLSPTSTVSPSSDSEGRTDFTPDRNTDRNTTKESFLAVQQSSVSAGYTPSNPSFLTYEEDKTLSAQDAFLRSKRQPWDADDRIGEMASKSIHINDTRPGNNSRVRFQKSQKGEMAQAPLQQGRSIPYGEETLDDGLNLSIVRPMKATHPSAIAASHSTSRREEGTSLRTAGTTFDSPSRSRSSNTSHMPVQQQESGSTESFIVAVKKKTPEDKIGIFVGLKTHQNGASLVVTRVSPSGLLSNSPMEPGDVVLSINGIGFTDNPSCEEALDIVRHAEERVIFVVQKSTKAGARKDVGRKVLSPALRVGAARETINPDKSKTVTREVHHDDGTQTLVAEYFDRTGQKVRMSARTREMTPEGKLRDLRSVSVNSDGEIVLSVARTTTTGVDLHIQAHRNELRVETIVATGAFVETPLKVGDIILSINGVDFRGSNDVASASSLLSEAGNLLTIVARKDKTKTQVKNGRQKGKKAVVNSRSLARAKDTGADFDEQSYCPSVDGYQSSRTAKVTKKFTREDSGIVLACEETPWGQRLVVADMSEDSKLAQAGLAIGDIILSINGINFSEYPDAFRADAVLRDAKSEIAIEYQRLTGLNLDGPEDEYEDQRMPFKATKYQEDAAKTTRTQTRSMNTNRDIGTNAAQFIIPESKGKGKGKDTTQMIYSNVRSQNPVFTPRIPTRITKVAAGTEIGLSMATGDGRLYVREIAAGSVLEGKGILAGDVILAINDQNFRKKAVLRDAYKAILIAEKTITLHTRVNHLSTDEQKRKFDREKKTKLHEKLICSRPSPDTPVFEQFYV